jgi:hypothetical protein
VLLITGYAEAAVLGHGHLDPGMHVITKPFSLDALAGRAGGRGPPTERRTSQASPLPRPRHVARR